MRRTASAVGGEGGLLARRPLGPPVEGLGDRLPELDAGRGALFDVSRHHEESIDDQGEAIDLGLGGLELAPQVGILRHVDGRLEAKLHAGQRRAELVRRVRHEFALRTHRSLQPFGHLVERAGDLVHFGGALDIADASG